MEVALPVRMAAVLHRAAKVEGDAGIIEVIVEVVESMDLERAAAVLAVSRTR
jgi:hypothetical protein